MSNNCLVTKLKGSVDNENLVKLGYIRFLQETNGDNKQNHITLSKNGIVYFENCTYNGSRQLNINALTDTTISNSMIVLDSGETVAKYQVPLYTLSVTNFGTEQEIDCDKIIYADGKYGDYNCNLLFWRGPKFIGDIDKVLHTNLHLFFGAYNSGEIIDVTDIGLQGNAICFDFNGTNFIGSLDNVGFKIGNYLKVANTKNVSLNVETFVKNAVSAGITTNNVSCNYLGASNTTFKGVPITLAPANTLAWEPYGTNQTKITLTVGEDSDTEIIDNLV